MTRIRRSICLTTGAVLLGALTGCANPVRQLTPTTDTSYWSGRMSVHVLDSPPQTTSGSFELQGNADNGELVLLTPLGNIVARVQWDASHAKITQGSQTRQADSLDSLIQDLLGTNLPIAALFDWLNGQETRTQGWSADLSARSNGKILAHRTSPLPEASLRIVLDEQH
jgi:outer membrane lipoprotein LolB